MWQGQLIKVDWYLKTKFQLQWALLSHKLPQELTNAGSIGQFKQKIKQIFDISDFYTAIL